LLLWGLTLLGEITSRAFDFCLPPPTSKSDQGSEGWLWVTDEN
jgi:hypothetical protein